MNSPCRHGGSADAGASRRLGVSAQMATRRTPGASRRLCANGDETYLEHTSTKESTIKKEAAARDSTKGVSIDPSKAGADDACGTR